MYNRVFSWLRIASFKHQNFYTVILTTWRQHLSKMYSKCPVFLFSVKQSQKFPSRPGFLCSRVLLPRMPGGSTEGPLQCSHGSRFSQCWWLCAASCDEVRGPLSLRPETRIPQVSRSRQELDCVPGMGNSRDQAMALTFLQGGVEE